MKEWNPGTHPETCFWTCPVCIETRAVKVGSKPVPGTAPCRNAGGIFRVSVSWLGGTLLPPGHSIQSPVCCPGFTQ